MFYMGIHFLHGNIFMRFERNMIASLYCFNLGENKICKLKDQISVINFYESNYWLRRSNKKFNQNRTVTLNKKD